MGRGRKPIPTNLHILRGNPGKRPLPKNEPQPIITIPDPPQHLSDLAKTEWARITPELELLGLLSEIDRSALAAYCQTYGRWVEAEDGAKRTGLIVKTKENNIIQSPLVGIANRAMELMCKFLVEFGMTPSSRTRLVGKDKNAAKSKWGAISGAKTQGGQ